MKFQGNNMRVFLLFPFVLLCLACVCVFVFFPLFFGVCVLCVCMCVCFSGVSFTNVSVSCFVSPPLEILSCFSQVCTKGKGCDFRHFFSFSVLLCLFYVSCYVAMFLPNQDRCVPLKGRICGL